MHTASSLGKFLQTYDNSGIPLLVSTLRELFDLKSSVQVLIAASIRNEKTFETFVNACSGPLRICPMSDWFFALALRRLLISVE